MMTKQLFTTQENYYSLTIIKLGLRETVGYWMSRWERTIERRFVSQLGFFTLRAIKIIREKEYRVV